MYSFGVLLCEMCIRELPDPQRRENQIERIENWSHHNVVSRCVKTHPNDRPDMKTVIELLEGSKRPPELKLWNHRW